LNDTLAYTRCWSIICISGPTWFLAWLLLFNTAYATAASGDAPLMIKFPSCMRIFQVGGACIYIQSQLLAFGLTVFIFMPITIGSLNFDCLFFFLGCIAERNRWLDIGLKNMTTCVRYSVISLSCISAIAFFVGECIIFAYGGTKHFISIIFQLLVCFYMQCGCGKVCVLLCWSTYVSHIFCLKFQLLDEFTLNVLNV
jgi:hypothetical protein